MGVRPTNGGGNQRTLNEAQLKAERVELRKQPGSPERTKALGAITRKLARLACRSERGGV